MVPVRSRIQSIENVETMVIPNSVSKFQILTRVKNEQAIRTV